MRILEGLQAQFEGYVWGHVLSMLMGLMLLKERKTLSALRYRESLPTLSRTLNVYPWPLEQLAILRRQVVTQALQKQFLKRRGRRPIVYLILDDTVIPKRGLHLPQLGFHHSSTQDRVVRGWDLVFAALRVGKLTVPWAWYSYVNERFAEAEDFRKRTELAADLIEHFQPPWPAPVVVLADSAYCCQTVLEAVQRRGFVMVGLLKKDRCLSDGRKAWQVEEETIAYLKGTDHLAKMVHRGRGRGRRTVLCTDLTIGRTQILKHLKCRWSVEVMFRILKEQFGLGDCRCRGAKSLNRWVELVLLAYAIAGLTRWGRQLLQQKITWLEARCHWGNRLICPAEQVHVWLATLIHLISWTLKSAFSPLPKRIIAS